MYLNKSKISSGVSLETEIAPNTIRKICDICRTEIPINFDELYEKPISELFAAAHCDNCNSASKRYATTGVLTTLEDIIWAGKVLLASGYEEEIDTLYYEYGIDTLNELTVPQYPSFGRSLSLLLKHRAKNSNFAGVPDYVRNGLSDTELDETLSSMGLPPAIEEAVRQVCKHGLKTQKTGGRA